ncbi:hypothetical protein AWV79_37045 [Cupriavidus sp. UYMMa02A]|nr:hypothetical protein AWV79_37045 [Cupriavidus sp. UYMMa02A]
MAGGTPVTVVVNHFKSKISTEATGAPAEQGDGQGWRNPACVQAAEALASQVIGVNRYAMGGPPLCVLALHGYAGTWSRILPVGRPAISTMSLPTLLPRRLH